MKKNSRILQFFFAVIAAADIAGIAAGSTALHYIAKPLLLPILIVLITVALPAVPGKKLLLTALFFSWLGDVFLLFENKHALFFIFGLASFLTTHVLYILYFLSVRSPGVSLLKKQPLLTAAVIIYGAGLVWLLFPYLKDLKLPVLVYAAVICTMLLCSLHIFYKTHKAAAECYIWGALLFVVSDSLLAVNKFHTPFPMAGIAIMSTYCAAQYLIVTGFIKQYRHDQD